MVIKLLNNHTQKMLAAIILLLVGISTGCLKDNAFDCVQEQQLYIKLIDSSTGEDLTTSENITGVSLFIFDQDNRFLDELEVSPEQIKQQIPITIHTYNTTEIHIHAWGNLNDSEYISPLNKGDKIDKTRISLKVTETGHAFCPDDLFYGEKVILNKGTASNLNEVLMYRKNARMHITVRGLKELKNVSSYYFTIDKKYNGYNFKGDLLEEPVSIKQTGHFENKNHDFETPHAFNVIHYQTKDEGITIHLHNAKTDKILLSIDKTDDGAFISPLSGETANILIDLKKGLNVSLETTLWDGIHHWETW